MFSFQCVLLTCWYGLNHQLYKVLLLKLLESRSGRAPSAFGCGSTRPPPSRTTASTAPPPPAAWPGASGRSTCCRGTLSRRKGSRQWRRTIRNGGYLWWSGSFLRRHHGIWASRSFINGCHEHVRLREDANGNTSHCYLTDD